MKEYALKTGILSAGCNIILKEILQVITIFVMITKTNYRISDC